jgi:hypothetical protein
MSNTRTHPFVQNSFDTTMTRSTLCDGNHTRNSVTQKMLSSSKRTKSKFKDTLHALLGPKVNSLLFDIDVPIVDTIIGGMFFHPDDFGTSSHVNTMKPFKRNTTSHNGNNYEPNAVSAFRWFPCGQSFISTSRKCT